MIFNLVKTLFIAISVLIIYSLLMVSVESKTFETAVIRMLGLQAPGVIGLVVFQALLYVIPAMVCAFFASILLLQQASIFFEENYKVTIDPIPSLVSTAQAIAIGTIIPLFSSILPI